MRPILKFFATLSLYAAMLSSAGAVWAQAAPDIQAKLDQGQLKQALESLSQQGAGLEEPEARLQNLSARFQIELAMGQLDEAEASLGAVLAILDEHEKLKQGRRSPHFVIFDYQRAQWYFARGRLAEAKKAIRSAIERANQVSLGLGWDGALEYQASLIFDDENTYARRHAEAAIRAYDRDGLSLELGFARLRMAELEWARSKPRRAFSEYALALQALRKADAPKPYIADLQLLMVVRYIEQGDRRSAQARLDLAEELLQSLPEATELQERLQALRAELSTAAAP